MITAFAKLSSAAAILLAVAACAGTDTGSGTGTGTGSDTGATTTSDNTEVLARIGDREITAADLIGNTPILYAEIRRKSYDLYEAKQQAADQYVINEMIAAEALERGATPQEIYEAEVDGTVPQPSEVEIQSFFDVNQQYARGRSIEELRPNIITEIRRPQLVRAQARFLRQLREKYDAKVIVEPVRIDYTLPATAPVKGPQSAPITLVEFADFQCPSCKAAHPLVQQLLAEYGDKIRYAFVDFPLPNHSRAIPASVAARCAADQDNFWDFSDNLMVIAGDFADTDLYARAANLGLDANTFSTCLQSNQHEQIVQSHLAWGQSLGIGATPSFLINDRLVVGSKPFEQMKALIDAELERAG